MKVFFFPLPKFLTPPASSRLLFQSYFIPFPLLPTCCMMYIFDLPIELLKVILEHVSLKDIARLQLAASNRHFQQILSQTLNGLLVKGDVYDKYTYLEWMRKYRVRLSCMLITGKATKSSPLISYLEEQGQYVTELRFMLNCTSAYDTALERVSLIGHNLPNINVVRYSVASSTFEQFYQLIQSLPIRKLSMLVLDSEIAIKQVLIHLSLLETLEVGDVVNFDGMEDSVYPAIKHLECTLTDISNVRYFSNLETLVLFDLELSLKNAEILCSHCPHLISFDITSHSRSFEGIHHLLRSLRSLAKLTIFTTLSKVHQSIDATPAQQTTSLNLVDVSIPHTLMATVLPYCPNLRDLQLRTSNSIYRREHVNMLQSLKQLRTLKIESYTNSCDVIFDLLSHPHSELTTINIYCESQTSVVFPTDNIPAYLPVIPKLRAIQGLYQLSPATCAVLRQCPALTKITVNDNRNDIDIELLYAACPHLKSITYREGPDGYKLLQFSHEKLERITIPGDSKEMPSILNNASFPSLRALEVHGDISMDSWNDILTTASFNIEQLVLAQSSSLEAIWDSLLAHSNFSGLKYVFCDKLDYAGMQQLSQRSGGRIQFHRVSWLQ